jgi:hypothetical protein
LQAAPRKFPKAGVKPQNGTDVARCSIRDGGRARNLWQNFMRRFSKIEREKK